MTDQPHKIAFRRQMDKTTLNCPVCKGPAFIRTSEEVTDLCKELYVHCANTSCALTWKAQLSFVYTLSPSGIEHDLDLPMAPANIRRLMFTRDAPPDPNQTSLFEDTG